MIFLILVLTLFSIIFGVYSYFFTDFEKMKEVSIGFIVLGIGMVGFIKTAVETFENHRKNKI